MKICICSLVVYYVIKPEKNIRLLKKKNGEMPMIHFNSFSLLHSGK